jgi:hypothetical protein
MNPPSSPADDPFPTTPAPQPRGAIPIALYALRELHEALDRAGGAPDELAINEAIDRHVLQPVLREARTPPEWWIGPNYNREEVASEVMDDLWSGTAPPYDHARWTLPSHYYRHLVRGVQDRIRNRETTRPVVRKADPSNPGGPPLVDRPRHPRFRRLLTEIDAGTAPAEGNDTRQEFRAAVEQLSLNPTERAIIEGHYFGNRPLNEVAPPGVSAGAVYKTHERLLEKLRLLLARFGED